MSTHRGSCLIGNWWYCPLPVEKPADLHSMIKQQTQAKASIERAIFFIFLTFPLWQITLHSAEGLERCLSHWRGYLRATLTSGRTTDHCLLPTITCLLTLPYCSSSPCSQKAITCYRSP